MTIASPSRHVVRHRLFAVDIFARGDAIEHHAPVLKIGDGDDHRIHILAIEQANDNRALSEHRIRRPQRPPSDACRRDPLCRRSTPLGTLRAERSRSHPRIPVPMETKRILPSARRSLRARTVGSSTIDLPPRPPPLRPRQGAQNPCVKLDPIDKAFPVRPQFSLARPRRVHQRARRRAANVIRCLRRSTLTSTARKERKESNGNCAGSCRVEYLSRLPQSACCSVSQAVANAQAALRKRTTAAQPDLRTERAASSIPPCPRLTIQAQIDKVYAIQQHSEFGTAALRTAVSARRISRRHSGRLLHAGDRPRRHSRCRAHHRQRAFRRQPPAQQCHLHLLARR